MSIEFDKEQPGKTNLDRLREMSAEEIGAFIKSIGAYNVVVENIYPLLSEIATAVVKNIYPLLSETATALVPLVKLIAEYPELLEAYQRQAALNEPINNCVFVPKNCKDCEKVQACMDHHIEMNGVDSDAPVKCILNRPFEPSEELEIIDRSPEEESK